jgi:inhibitor of KinA sporulation pathway (predicted exonuclease)
MEGYATELEYLLVLDFEATCVEDKKIEPCPEIIEFPVVVVHARTGKTLDRFHLYVKPRFNPQLTPFCTQLTGITQ